MSVRRSAKDVLCGMLTSRRFALAVLRRTLPTHITDQVEQEMQIFVKHTAHARNVRHHLYRLDECRLNIGCGSKPTPGWINIDRSSSVPGVYCWDCRRGLPFADAKVAAIYMEHVFEHFDLESEGKPLLSECLRVLRPNGVVRIVVPDAGAYLRAYNQAWEPLAAMRPLERIDDGWRDKWLRNNTYRTQMQLINAVFRQNDEHKYAYDEETLMLVLQVAGFATVIPQSFGVSVDNDMAPDRYERKTESLYVEAIKR